MSIRRPDHLPASTYRLQLTPDFTLRDAAALADYLAELGVGAVYCSPYLQAGSGSRHGYDVIDHNKINAELGGKEALEGLHRALRRAGLGQVLDIVPNHASIEHERNRAFNDVLARGPSSEHAQLFDIDWDSPEPRNKGKVLLPVLGDHLGAELAEGRLRLELDQGRVQFRYYDHCFPVDGDGMAEMPAGLSSHEPQVLEQAVVQMNARPGMLTRLLQRQHYRLACWRLAGREINYRRFFAINHLIGLRQEDEEVFRKTHALVLELANQGMLTGLRVDHPDGLAEPRTYLRRLAAAAPGQWIVVEKILQAEERLPEDWPVSGTTGYDFLNVVNGLFVDPAGEQELTRLYAQVAGETADWKDVAYRCRKEVLEESFQGELSRLTQLGVRVLERHFEYRDFSRLELHDALAEFAACMPIYRTYVTTENGAISAEDGSTIRRALACASRQRPDVPEGLWELLGKLMRLELRGPPECELVRRFQQLAGPLAAKGIEDRALYRYHRLDALNEVGGDLSRFGTSVERFHEFCAYLASHWPGTMTTTGTHDTKRGEDCRLRMATISERPAEWALVAGRWFNEHAGKQPSIGPNIRYLLYQTLVGTCPIDAQRLGDYMIKAAREAAEATSWTDPDAEYEEALRDLVGQLLRDNNFGAQMSHLLQSLLPAARVHSLSHTLLRCTAPGVCDCYQGAELWDESLVDPDNRRAVDYDLRRRLLKELEGLSPQQTMARMEEGIPKLLVLRGALRLRRMLPDVFGLDGGYQPLAVQGPQANRVVAFCRGERVCTIVPRLVLGLEGGWGDTAVSLPAGRWRDCYTSQSVPGGTAEVQGLLNLLPVALLVREGEP